MMASRVVTPAQALRMTEAAQRRGHTVKILPNHNVVQSRQIGDMTIHSGHFACVYSKRGKLLYRILHEWIAQGGL